MKIGDKLKGRITGIQPYGAFVELETGDTGLIHISEIRTGFIENIQEALKVDEEVQVQVVDLDEFTGESQPFYPHFGGRKTPVSETETLFKRPF